MFGGGAFLLGFREQQGAKALGAQLVDADDGLREGGSQLATGDEVLGFLHDHTHLLEVVGGDAVEATRIDDEDGALDTNAGHTKDVLVGGFVDVNREELGMAQGPAELGVDVEVEVGVLVVDNLIDTELIEAHKPVGLIESVLAHQGRLFQDGQTRVVGVDADVAGVIDASHGGLLVHGVRHAQDVEITLLRGAHNHLGGLSCRHETGRVAELFPIVLILEYPLLNLLHGQEDALVVLLGRQRL